MGAVPQIACFMFHEVTNEPAETGFQRPGAVAYKHSSAAFAEYLAQIAGGPVAPSLVTAIDLYRGARHVLLTFDDGGKSALQASDALNQRGWKGHFFIVTSLIGGRTFLAGSEIRHLRDAGHLIGTHSHTHPNIFKEQPFERMVEEWRVSCDILAQLLGEPCVAGSVPGGDISPAVLESAPAAGLRYLFTSEPWLAPRRIDACWMLGRFSVKVGTSPERVGALAQFHGWTRALAGRRLKVLASTLLPTLYRAYVRKRTQRAS